MDWRRSHEDVIIVTKVMPRLGQSLGGDRLEVSFAEEDLGDPGGRRYPMPITTVPNQESLSSFPVGPLRHWKVALISLHNFSYPV
ncbi:hypothetical protein DUI87_18282 [Hirundo rustica rustica]|uniref:Uncharacterized protein n=1 Tax=Hirundo rustica rustica TaxID=333673 RepID=A0A3M0K1H0_HIRRU|nr:hypothetical protein DUI87_18282 [Hirundo rustica rustica]